ncbi:MAG: hypothetical protein HRU13_01280 [Phycisphaerales bacterium]|nr:hypothetical protein [Phycisphaerales bacterium]
MPAWERPAGLRTRLGFALACAFVFAGCAKPDPLTPPQQLISPYASTPAEPIWAVVPLLNESGTTAVDEFAISDTLSATITQTRGLRSLPLNRTLDAMRAMEMARPETPADLDRLARALGADGLLVGSITAYDPFEPIVGLSIALYARPGSLEQPGGGADFDIDARQLREQPTEYDYFGTQAAAGRGPASSVVMVLDGRDHDVRMRVRRYAEGRRDAVSALGWERYLRSMPEYERFVAFEAVGQLLQREWVRLARDRAAGAPAAAPLGSPGGG